MGNTERQATEHIDPVGFLKGLEQQVSFQTLEDAEAMFVIVKKRLLDINNWHQQLRSSALKFQLADRHGHILFRPAHKDDLVLLGDNIATALLPENDNWARVDALIYDDFPDEQKELFSIQLHIEATAGKSDSCATLLCLSIDRDRQAVFIRCNHAKADSAEDHLTDERLSFSLTELIEGLMLVPDEE